MHTESDLRKFFGWCAEHGLDPSRPAVTHLELYVRWMQEIRRFQPSTVSRRMSVVAGFYRTCVIDGGGATPAEYVRRPRVPPESPTLGLTHLQFEALLTAARTSANPNDFALVCLLGLLGLRVFEATGISLEDLGEEHGHRVVRVRGKGGKVVLVPLPPASAAPSTSPLAIAPSGLSFSTSVAFVWTGTPPPDDSTARDARRGAAAADAPAHAAPHLRHQHARRRCRPA